MSAAEPEHQGQRMSWTFERGVVEVRLHHGPCNAIDDQTMVELDTLLDQAEVCSKTACLLFHSDQPQGFCSGAALESIARLLEGEPEAIATKLERLGALFTRLDQIPLATVGALHGVVFGGGFEWALCLDLLVAERSTRVALPELRLGLLPGFGGLTRLQRDCGNALARELLLTGRSLGARRLHALGLVTAAVPRGEGLAAARASAHQLARIDGPVRRRAKRALKPAKLASLASERAALLDMICARDGAAVRLLDHTRSRSDRWSYLP